MLIIIIKGADNNEIIKVFIKCKILSIQTIPSTHTHTQAAANYTKLNLYTIWNRQQTKTSDGHKVSSTEWKTWQVYSFGKRNVLRSDLSAERVSVGEEGEDNSGLTQHFPFLFVSVQELAPLLLQHMLQPLELFNVQWLQADQLVPQQQSSLLLAVHTSMPRNTAQTRHLFTSPWQNSSSASPRQTCSSTSDKDSSMHFTHRLIL